MRVISLWDLPRRPGDLSVAPDPRDRMSVAACQYLHSWATTVYNTAPLPVFPAGGPCATTGTTPNTIGALNPSLWTMTLPMSNRSVRGNTGTDLSGRIVIPVTNLTGNGHGEPNVADEQYVNGGFDTRTVWGFNFSAVGARDAVRSATAACR